MNGRSNFAAQLGLNAARTLPTVAASAALALGGGQQPGSVTYATERRAGLCVSRLGFDGEAEVDPQPIGDTRPVPPEDAATYKATWRTVPDPVVIEKLKAAGIYWFTGGSTHPSSSRKRVYLDPNTGDCRHAELICKWAIQNAGGDPSDLEVSLPNAERVRQGVEAMRRFKRENEATARRELADAI